ncbi:MAG: acyl-CoA dehydrogenase family protein [Pyrinomonadaceae bacterium]
MGDPADPQSPCSFKRSVELDEQEKYPEEFCRTLEDWGFYDYYIPAAQGGKFRCYEELLALSRVLSRRDLTVAIALGQVYLGAVPVWVAGTDVQKRRVAELVRGKRQMAFALSEKGHGSDILASDVRASANAAGGYLLAGEKWLINNGTRAGALTVFARTSADGGPRGFSLFLVEKDRLNESSYTHLPRVKTVGIRGADISGIRFDESELPPEALIGPLGAGLENALTGLMITRTLCAAFSLGAADTALRATLDFALSRRLYNDTVFTIPSARSEIVDAFIDLLTCDCVAIAAVRGLHAAAEQSSLCSAVVKYFVPTTIEDAIRSLSVVLGARGYLREEHRWGVFQKMARDNAVVSLFDGSTAVNLHAITLQLKHLTSRRAKAGPHDLEQISSRRSMIFSLDEPLAEFDPKRLAISGRGQDDVLRGLELSLPELYELKTDPEVDSGVLETIISLTEEMIEELVAHDRVVEELGQRPGYRSGKAPELFKLAKNYCVFHAAAACVQMWLYNRRLLGVFFGKGEWLALCLDRLRRRFHPNRSLERPSYVANVADEMVRLYREGRLFSVAPFRLAAP